MAATGHGEAASQVVDVVIVGAGFTGLYALHELRRRGYSARVLERGDDVGGTWYWNRYPGARCDIESIDYAYSFSDELLKEWRWSERFAAQPEILRYLNHVADRFDLRRDISFEWEVVEAVYSEEGSVWTLKSSTGDEVTARACILGVGNLSEPKLPDIPGLDTFKGQWIHSARWPDRHMDFSGKRVGVIGTGSSGIQIVTALAKTDAELFVLQRTPSYSLPARNRQLTAEEQARAVETFAERREACRASHAGVPTPGSTVGTFEVSPGVREARYNAGWERGGLDALSSQFRDFFTDEAANKCAQGYVRRQIARIVRDPATARALMPAYHIGTRRTCVDTGYFESYNRDNVHLVDLRTEPILEIAPEGPRIQSRTIAVDVLIFAIGFDAMTGAITAIDIRGREGRELREAWSAGPKTLLGLQTAGFPNLFFVTGPGSPSVLSNMVVSIEQHVEWIADCLDHMRYNRLQSVEATPEAQESWTHHVNDLAQGTLYVNATSWYLGSNIPGKPRVFMPYVGGVGNYRGELEAATSEGYRGFAFEKAQPTGTTQKWEMSA